MQSGIFVFFNVVFRIFWKITSFQPNQIIKSQKVDINELLDLISRLILSWSIFVQSKTQQCTVIALEGLSSLPFHIAILPLYILYYNKYGSKKALRRKNTAIVNLETERFDSIYLVVIISTVNQPVQNY